MISTAATDQVTTPVGDLPPPSLRDQIYERLVSRIRRGEVGPDERFVDSGIAAELGVSRMPARDALMRLAHEGYLEATTRGFMLPRLSHAEILEVFELRRLVEPRAAALAAHHLGADGLGALHDWMEEARRSLAAKDAEALIRASEGFRNCWLSAVPNATLIRVIQRYMTQIQVVRMRTFGDPAIRPVIVAGNQRLLEAFMRGDSVAAADALMRFVYAGEAAYLSTLNPGGEAVSAAARPTSVPQ